MADDLTLSERIELMSDEELIKKLADVQAHVAVRSSEIDAQRAQDANDRCPPQMWREFHAWRGRAVAFQKRVEAELSIRKARRRTSLDAVVRHNVEAMEVAKAFIETELDIDDTVARVLSLLTEAIEKSKPQIKTDRG